MTTYTELVADMQEWNEDDSAEFVAAIPDIIARAEDRIFADIPKLRSFRTLETGTLVSGTATFDPTAADIRTIRSLHITVSGSEAQLVRRTDTFIKDYWPDPSSTGQPKYFAEINETTVLMAPTPDDAYPYTLRYTRRPTGLSSSNANTFLGGNYPTLLHKSAYLETGIFLREPQTEIAARQAEYSGIMGKLAVEVEKGYLDENTSGV